jgi:hypothetical protein
MKKMVFIFGLNLLLNTVSIQADDRYFVKGKGYSNGNSSPNSFDCDRDENKNIISQLTDTAKINADSDANTNCKQLDFTTSVRFKDYKLSFACFRFGSSIGVYADSIYECK